jgi:hypothetical protein
MSNDKKNLKKYDLLPLKITELEPWVMVFVDLVGPIADRT